jgi:hypothetical protein
LADQLSLYNGALLICGERFLASLTEEVEPRRLLDRVWSSGGGVKTCLEMGQWNFAMRTVQIDYDPSVEPTFGYNRAFPKPSDWVLTSALCADEFMREPLTRYRDEAGYWYSDLDTLYVSYVSSDLNYGLDMNKWPESFREYVEHFFASKIIKKLSNSEEAEAEILKLTKDKLKTAKSRAAMAEPTSFPARGSWGLARNRFPNRKDGGNSGSSGNLIG